MTPADCKKSGVPRFGGEHRLPGSANPPAATRFSHPREIRQISCEPCRGRRTCVRRERTVRRAGTSVYREGVSHETRDYALDHHARSGARRRNGAFAVHGRGRMAFAAADSRADGAVGVRGRGRQGVRDRKQEQFARQQSHMVLRSKHQFVGGVGADADGPRRGCGGSRRWGDPRFRRKQLFLQLLAPYARGIRHAEEHMVKQPSASSASKTSRIAIRSGRRTEDIRNGGHKLIRDDDVQLQLHLGLRYQSLGTGRRGNAFAALTPCGDRPQWKDLLVWRYPPSRTQRASISRRGCTGLRSAAQYMDIRREDAVHALPTCGR